MAFSQAQFWNDGFFGTCVAFLSNRKIGYVFTTDEQQGLGTWNIFK